MYSLKDEVRQYIDPLLITLRESLYGSGVSFGRVYEGALPTTVIYTTNIEQVVGDKGYIKGITTYSGNTVVGTNQKELAIYGASVYSVGSRTVVVIPSGLVSSGGGGGISDPTTTAGDLIYRSASTLTRLPIGNVNQVLTVSGNQPIWKDAATGFTNPMTAAGDLIIAQSGGVAQRLAIGLDGKVLTAVSGMPAWVTPSGTRRFVYGGTPTGTINGSNTVFTLPTAAQTNTLQLFIRTSGSLGGLRVYPDSYVESGNGDVTGGKSYIESGHYASEDASRAFDDNNSTAWAGATPGAGWVGVDFGAGGALAINRVKFTTRLTGGYGGVSTYRIDYSDNGSSWTAATITRTTVSNTDGAIEDTGTFTSVGAHRYWRLNVLTTITWEPSVKEVEMFSPNSGTSSITMTTAPATGSTLLVDYEEFIAS